MSFEKGQKVKTTVEVSFNNDFIILRPGTHGKVLASTGEGDSKAYLVEGSSKAYLVEVDLGKFFSRLWIEEEKLTETIKVY